MIEAALVQVRMLVAKCPRSQELVNSTPPLLPPSPQILRGRSKVSYYRSYLERHGNFINSNSKPYVRILLHASRALTSAFSGPLRWCGAI